MPSKRGYGGSVALGRQVYVMGGGNDQQWLQDTLQLDLGTGAWGKVLDDTACGTAGYCGVAVEPCNTLQARSGAGFSVCMGVQVPGHTDLCEGPPLLAPSPLPFSSLRSKPAAAIVLLPWDYYCSPPFYPHPPPVTPHSPPAPPPPLRSWRT